MIFTGERADCSGVLSLRHRDSLRSTANRCVDRLEAAMSEKEDIAIMESLGFGNYPFDDGNHRHLVFDKGTGRAVIVMHELPGLSDAAVRFADRLVAEGFHVHLPLLFGDAKVSAPGSNFVRLRLCINKEFSCLRANVSAPICDWLRGLAREVGKSAKNERVGVIGMCLTGAFVIPMVLEAAVVVGVISQPSIPFSFRYRYLKSGKGPWMEEVNVSEADFEAAVQRAQRDNIPLMVQRFQDDRLCPPQRVAKIAERFGSQATVFHFASSAWNGDSPHALLTEEYDKESDDAKNPTRIALKQVIAFLKSNL